MKRVLLRLTPRARRDLEECIDFVARFPGGKPEERRRDIHAAFQRIREFPEQHPVEIRRSRSGLELRRHCVNQFAIVYAYLRPVETLSFAIVTVRAIQHRRERDVFFGVRENTPSDEIGALQLR